MQTTSVQNVSLFKRLGGTPGIERLVEEVVRRHMDNPNIGVRFRPYRDQPQ